MILFFPSQVRPTEGFGGWIGLLAQLLGLVRSIGHQVRRVCSLVVLSGCAWPEKRSGTRRRVFLFSSIASSASSLSFDYAIRARARAMRRDVTTCGVVTTATSTATVTSAGRDRMARCGVWVGLSRDRPPHMPLDLTCNHRYHAIRDDDRRHARGRLRRYARDLDSDRVGPSARCSREERRTAVVAAPRDAAE